MGRIRCGRAVVVPNIMAYATHSAVGIYDPGSHFLDLEELTSALVGDALAVMVRHAHAVRRLDPTAAWSSVNANYLPPAGASLVHPHLQSAHDAHGLTGQRQLAERSAAWQERNGNYWAALIDRRPAARGGSGRPAGSPGSRHSRRPGSTRCGPWSAGRRHHRPHRGRQPGAGAEGVPVPGRVQGLEPDLVHLRPDRRWPAFTCENGYQVVLKLVSRSNPEPLYRSDATERLWAEALINMNPRRGRGPADQVLRAGACCRGSGPFGTQTVLNCENSGARYTVVGERCTPVRHRWRQPGRSMHLMGSAARTFSRG